MVIDYDLAFDWPRKWRKIFLANYMSTNKIGTFTLILKILRDVLLVATFFTLVCCK